MRSEEQLRETFATLAERSPSSDAVLAHLHAQTSTPSRRHRRRALVLAAVAVVVLALVLPSLLTDRTAVPAGTRTRGNWNLVHRVDPPPGLQVTQQLVLADSELTVLSAATGNGDDLGECTVQVFGPQGEPMPSSTASDARVIVQGRDGFYRRTAEDPTVVPAIERGGVYWRHSADAWARAFCSRGRDLDVDLAGRVVFEPVPVRLPFELRSMPDGYRVLSVLPDQGAGPLVDVGVGLAPIGGSDPQETLGITVSPLSTDSPATPSGDAGTLAGRPAVFKVGDQSLCLTTESHQVCVVTGASDPQEEEQTSWPAGRRALVSEVAEQLRLVDSLTDRSSWTPADEALPR